MRPKTVIDLVLSLSAVACRGTATPTRPASKNFVFLLTLTLALLFSVGRTQNDALKVASFTSHIDDSSNGVDTGNGKPTHPVTGRQQVTLADQPSQVVAATTLAPALSFEKAPTGSEAQFIAHGRRSVMLKKNSAVLAVNRKSPSTSRAAGQDVRIEFAGANREPAILGEEELPGKVYYASGDFLGPLTGNPTFARVRYSELYRGIDAVFYGNDRELEFDFQVAPHADASQIRLSLAGTDKITLEPSGDLSLVAGGEQVRLKKPVIYQQRDGIRTDIAGGYRVSRSDSDVRFELGPYDHNLPLIIDPTVLFATYFGGAGNEFIVQLGANSIGDVYLMGSSSQPSTLPPHQTFTIGTLTSLQCFLTKLSADGTTALYTVLFAGANCGTMEVANNGKVHVSVNSGTAAGTVRTLNESTMSLGPLQGSYTIGLGTYQSFGVNTMRVDSAGNLYLIVTFVSSSGFVSELQKVNPQGQLLGKIQLLFAPVYPDGSIPDQIGGGLPGALDVDDAGHAYVVGLVKTPGAITPTPNAFHSTMLVKQAPYTDYRSDFLMRVDTTTANAFRIDYATFFGGSQDDPVSAVAFDPSSNAVVVAGTTNSPDFPTTPGTFAPSIIDTRSEGFLLKFDLSQPPSQQLIYGTFLNPSSHVYSLTMLPGGLPVVAGDATDSPVFADPFPLVNSLYPPQFTSKNRQFLSVFSPGATSLMFSTFLDSAPASQSFYPLLATNGGQTLFAATSTNFPGLSTSSAVQFSIAGGLDLFVRALDASDLIADASSRADLSLTATASPAPVNVGSVLTYSIAVTNLGPQPANAVSFTFGLPANVTFQSVTSGQGSCQTPAVGSTGTITCSLGTIADGAGVPLSVSVTAQASGPAKASSKVTSSTPDPNVANNTVNLETTVGTVNQYQLTTATAGSGSGTVTTLPSGTSCGVNCIAYDPGTTVVVTGTPSAGSSFAGFTGGGCGSTNPCSFTITASTTVTAAFTLNQYQLTTAATGNGSGAVTVFPNGVSCGVNCRAYDYGMTVTVTATPGVGSSFTGFTGGGCGSANPCSSTITASTTVTATFTLNQYQLTTATSGNGSGSVTVSPSGVSCGINCMAYNYGTTVTVTATPSPDSFFVDFNVNPLLSGRGCGSTNPCSLTITDSTTVTATFFLIQLKTATIGSGSGSITVSPSGVSCGVNCMVYNSGTTVTVTATPSPGSFFIGYGFSSGGCSTTNPCSFTITRDALITATFGLVLPPTGFEGYLYALVDVTNSYNRLYGFKVESTGALTPLGSTAIADSGSGVFGTERLAYDTHHKRLYVLHDGFHYVSEHVVDLGSGILTLESGPSLLNGGNWDCAALHPGGSPLVVGAGSLGRLASFTEPGSAPTLTTILQGGFFTGTARPFSCVFSQDGKFVYTGGNGNTNGGGTTIAGFSVNSANNDLLLPLPGSPFDVGSSVAAPYATDSDGRLFAADGFGGLLRVFTTSAGVPTAVNGSPFSSGISTLTHAVLHPAGLYMLADFDGDRIGVYQVAGSGPGTTLTAVSGSPFASGGAGPRVLALSDTGDFLFAANSTSHNIGAFRVDASGQLTTIGTQAPNALGTTGVVTGLAFVPIRQPVTSPPSIAKAFGASTIELGANTTLTFTLGNPNSWYLSGVAFTDPFPAGMIVANSNSVKNSCGGTVTVAVDLRSIALANGTIPASGTCTVSATITGHAVGSWTNVTGNITSTESGTGGTASATLTVAISLVSISVTPANPTIAPGGTQQFTATGTYSDSSTQNITGSVTWGSATPSVATITAGGLATGIGTGPALITARSGSISGSTTLTVVNPYSPPPPTCCTATGPYVDPAHGINIDVSKAGLSPSGTYQVVASGVGAPAGFANITVMRGSQVVLTAQTSFWGFSPDDDRFVTHHVQDPGGASIHHVTLYDLTGATPQTPIWRSDDSTHSSRIQFSPSGRYLFYTDVVDGPQTQLTLVDAHTGTPQFSDSIQPFPGAPIEGEDSFGTVDWGFGPNDSRFVYGYLSAQTNVEWNLVNLEKGPANARVKGISLLGEIADYWQFSPCGEVIGLVHQLGQQGVRVEIYNTKDGTSAGPGADIPSPIQSLQLHTTTASQVATNTTASGSTDYTLGANIPPCTVAVTVHSPVNILLVDEHGRRTGFDAATGVVVDEIPGGSYTGIGSEPQTITVPYVAGTYVIHAYGLDSLTSPEPYRLTIATSDSSKAIDLHEMAGMATSGSRQQVVFVLDDDGLITSLSPVDPTPPVIIPKVSGTVGSNGWYTSDVLVNWSVTDAESPIASSSGCAPASVSSDTAGTTFTCTATSAGGTASSSVTVKRDTTPPVIGCASPDGQWHASDLSLVCTAGDAQSGLANTADTSFLLTTHVAAGVETSAATDSRQVCDHAGNCATAGPVGGNKVDKKAPSVVITAPAGTYVLGQAVAASYSCTDGGSGVASCSGPVANGANIDTQTVGAKSFIVRSSDNVGNGSSAVAGYNVAYNICPLYTAVAKHSGSSYPIKIQLCDANGNNVSSSSIVVHAVSVTRVSANTPATLDDNGNASPDFDFRYDTTLNGYIFNLSTNGYASGTYTLNFTAGNDAALYSAQFAVK